MSATQAPVADGTIEECIDDLDELLSGLDRYSHAVLAAAMRAHLTGLLRALLVNRACTQREVSAFIRELERDTVKPADG
jgi:hypothetical protein